MLKLRLCKINSRYFLQAYPTREVINAHAQIPGKSAITFILTNGMGGGGADRETEKGGLKNEEEKDKVITTLISTQFPLPSRRDAGVHCPVYINFVSP